MPAQDDDADIRMLASGVVYEDNWMRLRRDDIERRDGVRGTYAFIEKRDFALVIPAERGGFHLVEEYRYPIGRRSWSFPQGGWPHGESGEPEELARLERRAPRGRAELLDGDRPRPFRPGDVAGRFVGDQGGDGVGGG